MQRKSVIAALCLLLFVLAGCQEPQPQPEPEPEPEPVEAACLYLIHETGDATPETAVVINDKVWKDAADTLGLKWEIIDDENGEKLLPAVVKAARELGLPAVVLRDADGAIVETVSMPADKAGMLSLVNQYGGQADGT